MSAHYKRFFGLFFMLIFLLFSPVLRLSTAAAADDAVDDYRDIPGVTREEIDAIEQIKRQHPEGLVYGMLYSEEAFITIDGQIGGYTRLVCKRLGDLFGITITPQIMEWDRLVTSLKNGSVDLSGELTATPARKADYFMTTPIADRSFAVFYNANQAPPDLLGSRRLRYGFLEQSITYERVREISEIPFEAVFVQDYKQAMEGLQNGTIDGFIYETATDSLLEHYPDIAYQEYYPVAFTSASLATANPSLRPLIDVAQKYLDHGGNQELAALYEEGKKEYLQDKLYKSLNEQERAYLESHIENNIQVPVAAEFDNYPVSFYNEQENRWQGIAHDILGEIQSLTGLTFEVTTQTEEPWNSILEKLEKGDVALITNLVKSKDRRGHYLWPDTPYSIDNYALLSRMELEDMPISQVTLSRVGLLEGSAYEEIFHRIFPDHKNFVLYPDAQRCFEAMENGEVDLVMMPRHLLLYITNYMERPGFKVNVAFNIPCESYFGFHREENVLCSIVSKAQSLIDCGKITDRWEQRVFDYEKKLAKQRVPYLAGISVLLLVILALVIVLYNKRERTSRQMVMTDPLTCLYNRRFFQQQVALEWAGAIKYRLPISLLTIDLDRFKEYNDTYGHPQGDVLLSSVSAIFRESLLRPADFAARIGGDEFSILLPNTDLKGALHVAENIQHKVECAAVPTADGRPTKITVSIGAVCATPQAGDKIPDFIEKSDQTLYRAKKEGSNRVYAFS